MVKKVPKIDENLNEVKSEGLRMKYD